jgi:hypothetical protein
MNEALDPIQAKRLLVLCGPRRRRAVDLLIEHLESRGGSELESLLASGPARGVSVSGDATLSDLIEAKRRCTLEEDAGLQGRLERLAGYFTVVAAALCHHRVLVCGRSLAELRPILIDLASVTEGSWSDLFARASAVEDPEAP